MIGTRPRSGALLAALLLPLSACAASEGIGSDAGGRVRVVTAMYPLQFVVERVAGDHAVVDSLTKPGAEPHDVELTPSQVAAVSTADLVVYERTFQPAVDEAVAQSANQNVLDVTTVVPLQPLEEGDDHGHADEEADAGESGPEEHPVLDPHVWLDPTQLATIADAVADKLSVVDPSSATAYDANAATLRRELSALDRQFASGLASCRRDEFITTHAAFGYLAKRYDLTQIGISGLSPDAEPSPARIAEVHRLAQEHGVTTIFYETLVSPAVARSIAADLSLKTDVLDPVEGITPESRGSDYFAVMRANLAALQQANSCS